MAATHSLTDEGGKYAEKTSGQRESCWFATSPSTSLSFDFRSLHQDITADTAIVGAGIAGLTTAYLLSRAEKKVVVLEDGDLVSGETGRTTAHITHALDDRYFNIEARYGKEAARMAAESHTKAIDTIESIVEAEQIDCDFTRLDGYLFLDPSDSKKSLLKELEATHRAGINSTQMVDRAPIESFDTGQCIRFPRQAQFHPLKYLAALARIITKNGGQIFVKTHVQEVQPTAITTSDGYNVKAKEIVVATNAPIVDKVSKMYEKQIPYRTYVIGGKIGKGSVPKALYWDTGNQKSKNMVSPYHYVRIEELPDSRYDLLIVGGEDHQTGNADDFDRRFSNLEKWAKRRFPIQTIDYRWSGQVMEPIDSLAFIGRNPSKRSGKEIGENNIFITTGDSGNGMTHGTIAGLILSDLILGKENDWARLYDPSRKIKKPQAPKAKTAPASRHAKKSIKLSPGEGIILKRKRNPLALYKDEDGQIHSFSAKCTHLGCTVTWNDLENSFDCRCHGSRFSPLGQVINGPANSNLESENST